MKKYTLKDLKLVDGRYYFPGGYNSGFGRTKEVAEQLLIICNYTGELTDIITGKHTVKLINDIEKIKKHLNI